MARVLKYLFLAALLCISISMPARELPPLPAEKNITVGTLENGIRYYLVAAPGKKGFADFALVRKGEIPSEDTAAQLKSLEKFSGVSPEKFLLRNGIGALRQGFYEDRDGSTVFRFPDVPLYNRAVADSTLLLTFALIAESPSPQTIIIAGDISKDDILRRMGLFSMLVPYLHREAVEDEYVWEPYISPSFTLKTLEDTDEALLSVSYFAPRTPRRYMDTSQPLIMDIFAREFEVLVRERLSARLSAGDIPYSSIDVDYQNSAASSGNVKYTISVGTDKDHIEAVMEAVSRTVSSLAAFGVGKDDFKSARSSMTPQLRRRARSIPTNRDYTERCIRACLYGSSLASRSEVYRIFARRHASDTVDVGFFNRISASFLNPSANADIRYEAPLDTLDDLEALFRYNLNYLKGSSMTPEALHRDSLVFPGKIPKVKVRKEDTDPVTGGTVWTFSNGFRVFYNQVKGAETLQYSFVFPEGYAAEGDLRQGEGGYFSDYLSLYKVGGISAKDFYATLASNGIELRGETRLASTTFSGTVPPGQFTMLLRALVALRLTAEPDPEALRTYATGEKLRLAARRSASYRIDARLFEALHPGWPFTPYKDPAVLDDALFETADRFYRERLFHGMSGGYLVLSGNVDLTALKKELCACLGGFGTRPAARPVGKTLPFVLSDGHKFLEGKDAPGRVRMYAECAYPLTGKTHYMAPAIEEAVRRIAVQAAGMRARNLRTECRFIPYPQERLTLSVTFDLAEEIPEQVRNDERGVRNMAKEVAEDILAAIGRKDAVTRTDADGYREMVLAGAEASFLTQEGLNQLVIARYSLNKDYKTHYKDNIQSISRDDLLQVLESLRDGSWAIYAGHGK